MVEEVEIQEPQLQQEPDPPKKKLWKSLSDKHLYTKSYEDFGKQFSTPESIDKLHKVLTEKELYTKNTDDFKSQFFSDLTPQVKKKVGRVDLEGSSMEAGNFLSQQSGVGGEEIPQIEMYTTANGEMIPTDPISLSRKYKELQDKTTLVSDIEGATSLPDEEAQKAAKKLAEDFKDTDLGGIYEETKDLSENLLANHGKRLMQERAENNPLYQRDIANLKWRSEFERKLLDDVDKGNIDPDNYNRIKHSIEMLPVFTSQGDYTNQRPAIQSLAKDIQEYGGENKEELLKNFAVEVSKVYGNPDNKAAETFKDTPESKFLSPEAQLGYQYIQDVSPEKAEQYKRLFIDKKNLSPDELRGYNHLEQTLIETGIGLQQNAITEELNSLKNQAEKNGGLSDEQINRAVKLEDKQNELAIKNNELDNQYPERLNNKIDDAIQEIMGQKISGFNYAGGKAFTSIRNTAQGIWEAASSPFMSDESNAMRELAIMGQTLEDESIYHKTDKNKQFVTDKLVIQPELQKQIDNIKNNALLTNDQKEQQLYTLLRSNKEQFGRVPIRNGKVNINGSSILYGLTDLGTALLPFIAIEMSTGGIGGAGMGAKFLRTFTAAAATTFHDEYASALLEGKGQSEAYKSAMASTAINSFAMAGAGTPTEIRAMVKGNSSAEKLIKSMSDDAIQKVLDKGTPKGLKGLKETIKERGKSLPGQFAQGLKTGAKFEAYMGAANAVNDREVNFKQMLINVGNFGILGSGLGQVGYKSPTQMQKEAGLKFGEKPEDYVSVAKQMFKNGQLSPAEFIQRTDLIEQYGEAYKTLPKANDKGESLSEKQRADYLYNSVIKNEGNKAKSNLPPRQAEKAEHTAKVADYENGILLENLTEKQKNDRKDKLEKAISKVDENGKPELSEKEMADAKAELEALENVIKKDSTKEEELPDLSVPIEGTDKKGVPIGEDVPKPTDVVVKLEAERDAEIDKVSKPDFKLELVKTEDLVNSKDPIGNREKHNELKERYKNLRKLIDCL